MENSENLIIVCSKNAAKNDAVKEVMNNFFDSYKIKSLNTNSGVSETPVGDEEGITGCLNRIKDALEQDRSGYLYVAMEGILVVNKYGSFLCGWTVIYNNKLDEYYYGCSSKVKIPDEIISNLDKSKRLSDVVAKYVGSTDEEVSLIGTNGILTHGVYTRTAEFVDSVLCAISSKFKKIK